MQPQNPQQPEKPDYDFIMNTVVSDVGDPKNNKKIFPIVLGLLVLSIGVFSYLIFSNVNNNVKKQETSNQDWPDTVVSRHLQYVLTGKIKESYELIGGDLVFDEKFYATKWEVMKDNFRAEACDIQDAIKEDNTNVVNVYCTHNNDKTILSLAYLLNDGNEITNIYHKVTL